MLVWVSSLCFLDENTILPRLSLSKSTHLESLPVSQSPLKTWLNFFTFMVFWISLNFGSLQIFISFSNSLISAQCTGINFPFCEITWALKNTLCLLLLSYIAQHRLPTRQMFSPLGAQEDLATDKGELYDNQFLFLPISIYPKFDLPEKVL